ncbi:hypothetical protein [Aliarcobacter lanthieri]|uniref:hypothetical protein n=1 Tax=Aliarcobacter lanthieri TaxID=1355374 RepID=UPI003AAA4524
MFKIKEFSAKTSIDYGEYPSFEHEINKFLENDSSIKSIIDIKYSQRESLSWNYTTAIIIYETNN